MKAALWINRILLTVLSIMTGLVKLAHMDAEMQIFRNVGFSDGTTVAFGVVQLVGGLLLIPNKTTRLGAWIMVPTFVFATYVVFANAMVLFGVFSFVFIAMALVHAKRWGMARGR